MADPADLSDHDIERTVESGIAAASNALVGRRKVFPVGHCLWCLRDFPETLVVDEAGDEQLVMSEKLFCGRECAGDWEHEQQRKRDLGR